MKERPAAGRDFSAQIGRRATETVIVVYTLAHAVGALRGAIRTECRITLLSAPGAGVYGGPGWFRGLVEAAREAVPDVTFSAILDCGDQAGAALAAIRAQIESVIFIGREDVAQRLADVARQHGVRLETTRPTAAIDLGGDFFSSADAIEQRCTEVLSARKIV